MIFDTHAHYDDEKFDEDRQELLASMVPSGIGRIVNIGCDIQSSDESADLADRYDFIYAAVGVHPSDTDQLNEESFAHIRELTGRNKVVAVGEIGLDYYWEKDEEKKYHQRYWFRRQIDLAREVGLPIVIHSRQAAQDTMDIAKEERIGDIGGVVHCYSYSAEQAKEYLKMGLYLGIGGVLTYKNARVLKEVVQMAPLQSLVLETDCPYLTPEPNRGKRNSSLNIPYVVEAISQIKGVSTEQVEAVTWDNAMRLYRMK